MLQRAAAEIARAVRRHRGRGAGSRVIVLCCRGRGAFVRGLCCLIGGGSGVFPRGEFVWSLSLAVPPGRSVFQPSLAIDYPFDLEMYAPNPDSSELVQSDEFDYLNGVSMQKSVRYAIMRWDAEYTFLLPRKSWR